jgi:hypothetical protein
MRGEALALMWGGRITRVPQVQVTVGARAVKSGYRGRRMGGSGSLVVTQIASSFSLCLDSGLVSFKVTPFDSRHTSKCVAK